MIRLFALNVSEEILNKFKDLEVHGYYDNFCIPIVSIYEDDKLVQQIINANYDRINSSILELRRRKESTRVTDS